MQKIELGDSLLGYLPNLTEKRKVVEQRQVSTLENVKNHYQWFEEKLKPVQAIFSVKEHVVRLLYTNDYGDYESENDIEPKFRVSQREYSLKTGKTLSKPTAEYIINDRFVMKTEYDFAKYLVENFDTLEEVQSYADNENKQIQRVIAEKEKRLQLENQKRLEAEQERRKQAQKDYEIALKYLEYTTVKNISKESEREKMVEKRIHHYNRKEENDVEKYTQELPNDPMELSQHALELVKNWSKDPKAMAEYLEFMSKFPELSPRNVALIHSQWRGANAVATFDQWNGKTTDIRKNMPKVLGIKSTDVEGITRTITDKKTGETKTIVLDGLSIRSGEKSQITLIGVNNSRYFEKENDGKVQRHYEKYWTAEDKCKVNNHEVEVKNYQKFYPYKVFEISQTNIKPERLPEVMPNRHINFEHDEKLVNSMKTGLEVYAQSLEQPVPIEWTKVGEVNPLGNAGGAFYPEVNKIVMNHLNTPGENITTLIHELTHASLHKQGSTQKSSEEYAKQELEAEMTAFVVSKHYGIDTQERSIPYIAQWTENAKIFDDKEMSQSLGKIQQTAGKMIKTINANLDPDLKKVQKIEQAHRSVKKMSKNIAQKPESAKQEIGR